MKIKKVDLRPFGLIKAIYASGANGKRGTISSLAKLIGISRQAVSQWAEVPLERVLIIEEKTKVPRAELRPDFYRKG